MTHKDFETPDEGMFCLWRAAFALVHADGAFSQEEKDYIESIVETFAFSAKQKRIIKKDLKDKTSVVGLFNDIQGDDLIRQFFVIARTIIWCDGFLHQLEQEAINKIVENLGENAISFQNELRWIKRKPIIKEGYLPDAPADDVMTIVVEQMKAFYKEQIL